MINHGPVDVIVVAAGTPRFNGSVFKELEKQTATGAIKVIDAMVLTKDEGGRQRRIDLSDLPPEDAAQVGFIESKHWGLFDKSDEETLFEGMVQGSAIVALAIEHTWAIDLVNKFKDAGVEMAFTYRVPAVVVDEVFKSL